MALVLALISLLHNSPWLERPMTCLPSLHLPLSASELSRKKGHSSVLTSSEKRALPAHHGELDTHVLASLLNGQVALPVDADDRDRGVQTPTSSDRRDDCAG